MTDNTPVKAASDAETIDLRELLGIFLDRKWLIVGVTGLFFVLSVAYALLATPIYRANGIVQVESKIPSIPGLAELTNLGPGAGAGVQATTEIALITSRSVVGTVVDQLDLEIQVEPERFPLVGGFLARRFRSSEPGEVASPWFGLSRYGWGGEVLSVFQLDVPDGLIGAELSLRTGDRPGSFELYDDNGDLLLVGAVGEVAQGSGITLQVETLNANPGTRFRVKKLSRLHLIYGLQAQVNASERGRDSGILQLSYEHKDPLYAQNFLQAVAETYVRQNVDRNSAEYASQLDFVREQLPGLRQQVEAAQTAMNVYQTQEQSVDITLQTRGLLEQEVAVETSIQQLRLRQAEMDRSYTREHPAYRALLSQIGELEARKRGFQNQVSQLPDTQQELLRLSRDLQVSNELYTSMLNQAQQLDIARAGTVGNVRIVDEAVTDATSPVKPRKPLIVLIGLFLGGLVSTGYIFLSRILNPGIEDPSQIEDMGIPVYAAIPLSPVEESRSKGKATGKIRRPGSHFLLAVNEPADLSVEALRSLRTSLHFAMLEAKNNILVLSGPRPEVGKTFISSNLAAVVAQAGSKVLVIDADMRRGTLHKALGTSPDNGLSDLLVGKLDIASAVRKFGPLENLHYITRGGIPPNPSELLMHSNLPKLLESLAPNYDLVIIDTPPVLAVTDATIVAQYSGSTLLVTRFGVNQPKEIALAKRRFEQSGIKVRGAIMNAMERRATGYYSYGYYNYQSATGKAAT